MLSVFLLHCLAAELTAGGVNIAPQLAAYRSGHAVALQPLLEGRHPAAGLEGALLHIVERESGSHAPASPSGAEPADLPASRVVNSVDHGVFKGDPPAGLFKIPVAGGEQLLHVLGSG